MKRAITSVGIGSVAGFAGSLMGMGGAFVAIPMLTTRLGLSQHLAQGTSMASVLATATGGCVSFAYLNESHRNEILLSSSSSKFVGNIHLPTAIGISLASTLTAVLGARFSKKLSERQLKIALGSFMLSMSPSPHIREWLRNLKGEETMKAKTVTEAKDWSEDLLNSVLIGVVSGFQAGLFGVGGGAVVVPALCLFTSLDYQQALATSLAIMLPTAVTGSIQHIKQGTMARQIAIPLGLGCLVGSYIGGTVVKQIDDDRVLRVGFSIMMIVLGLRNLQTAKNLIK
jgi:uncharacterized protein